MEEKMVIMIVLLNPEKLLVILIRTWNIGKQGLVRPTLLCLCSWVYLSLMPYVWLIVCGCFNHGIRNVVILVGKCAMCSKFKGLFLKSRPCQFLWFIRKLPNVTFSYKPILIIRSLRYSFGSCCVYFLNLKLLEDWRLMIFQLSNRDLCFFLYFPWGNFFFSINKTPRASLYRNAFYSDSILIHREVKGDQDAAFLSIWSVTVSWGNIWE